MAPPNLPVIDLTLKNINPSSSSWITKCDEVKGALEEHGCFIAMYDGASQELDEAIFLASQDLFDLPIEVKVLNTSDKPYHSYSGQVSVMPLYESLGIENATTTEGAEIFTKLMWPSGNKSFSTSSLMFSKAIAELYEIVLGMVTESYGIEEHCKALVRSTAYVLRFQKYICPDQEKEENPLGIVPHTDISFMTILCQDQVKGLEIKTKEGQWIEVDPSPSSFIVMAGDACTAFTNGRIEAPCHRVMMGNQERFSLGLFMFIRDLKIEIPQKLIDKDHPQRFREFDHYKYLHYHHNTNEGKTSKCPIKSYCGI